MSGKDDRFSEQRAALGAADVRACERIGKSCAVHIKRNIAAMADFADLCQLLQGVERSEFCGLGNVDQSGHDHMLVIGVIPVALYAAFNRIGVQFAVFMGQSDHFVPAGFDRAGFMCTDVACLGGDHALIRAKDRLDHGGISLGAADQKMDIGVRRIACFSYFGAGRLREFIGAVTGAVDKVCLHEALQDQGVSAFHVVGGKK